MRSHAGFVKVSSYEKIEKFTFTIIDVRNNFSTHTIIEVFLPDKEDEENSTNGGKQPTVVFPEPNEPLEDTSDIKSEADCTPKKSVGTCGRCLSGDQCIFEGS